MFKSSLFSRDRLLFVTIDALQHRKLSREGQTIFDRIPKRLGDLTTHRVDSISFIFGRRYEPSCLFRLSTPPGSLVAKAMVVPVVGWHSGTVNSSLTFRPMARG